jgi:hypothetical protein
MEREWLYDGCANHNLTRDSWNPADVANAFVQVPVSNVNAHQWIPVGSSMQPSGVGAYTLRRDLYGLASSYEADAQVDELDDNEPTSPQSPTYSDEDGVHRTSSWFNNRRNQQPHYTDCSTAAPPPMRLTNDPLVVEFGELADGSAYAYRASGDADLAHNVELNRQLVESTWQRVERNGRARPLSRTSEEPSSGSVFRGPHRRGHRSA